MRHFRERVLVNRTELLSPLCSHQEEPFEPTIRKIKNCSRSISPSVHIHIRMPHYISDRVVYLIINTNLIFNFTYIGQRNRWLDSPSSLRMSHLFVRNVHSFDECDDSGKQTPYMSSILRNLNRFITSARAISYCRLKQKLCARSRLPLVVMSTRLQSTVSIRTQCYIATSYLSLDTTFWIIYHICRIHIDWGAFRICDGISPSAYNIKRKSTH